LFIPSFFRITRAAALGLSKEQYVEESVLLGGSRLWVVRHHVWKKILPTVVVTTAGLIASGLLYVSSLAFLGVGAQPPTPTWGGMLADDLQYLSNSPTQAIWPGLVLLASIWSFNTLADAARDSLGIEPLPATGLKARIARRNARIAGQATNELTQNVA
jgi:peptide/nickel transport system permease protein